MENKPPMHLICLPEDILLAISVYLHVTDVLSLKQACNHCLRTCIMSEVIDRSLTRRHVVSYTPLEAQIIYGI